MVYFSSDDDKKCLVFFSFSCSVGCTVRINNESTSALSLCWHKVFSCFEITVQEVKILNFCVASNL
jgi:hypothetical protein